MLKTVSSITAPFRSTNDAVVCAGDAVRTAAAVASVPSPSATAYTRVFSARDGLLSGALSFLDTSALVLPAACTAPRRPCRFTRAVALLPPLLCIVIAILSGDVEDFVVVRSRKQAAEEERERERERERGREKGEKEEGE